jgi:hypothetical protein
VAWNSYRIAGWDMGGGQFFVEWEAIRSKIIDGLNPYSISVTNRIQARELVSFTWFPGPGRHYTSPLISGLIYLPFAIIPTEAISYAACLTAQFLVILLTFIGTTRLVNWRPPWFVYSIVILFILLNFHTVISWIEGGQIIWVTGFLVGCLMSIRSQRDELAGVLLALTMIQPQFVMLVAIFILFWAGSKRRYSLIFWFFATFVLLIAIGMFLVPDWWLQYLRILWNYRDHFAPGTPDFVFQSWWPGIGRQIGWLFYGIMLFTLILEWRRALKRDFRWFIWTACLTLVITLWIGIPTSPGQYYLLSVPLIFVIARLAERWFIKGMWTALLSVGIITILEWWVFCNSIFTSGRSSFQGLIFTLPGFLLFGMLWVRWWAIRPERLLIEVLRASE